MELNKLLHQYINDSRNPKVCFELGWEYEKQGQTASACGFYLRATEFGSDTKLQYEALLRMALCFEKQGDRWFMIKGLIQRAISLLPKRAEGYFLLARAHERNREWQEGYTTACIGMAFDFDECDSITNLEYPGKWVFEFEKAVCAWWIGCFDESLYTFRKLKRNAKLDDTHKIAVNNNLNTLSNNWVAPMEYTKADYHKLRYKFDGAHLVEKNYSQCYQDLFVLMATNGMEYGSWIEIGCAHPTYGNNTKLLEEWNWDGVSIDIEEHVVENWKDRVTNPYCLDATKIDWDKMPIWGLDNVTDYLQIDVDPAQISYEVLLKIPFHRIKFRVITFEHDYYVDESVKEKSRDYLRSFGYQLVVNDVAVNEYDSYEDWWVHPELVNPKIIELLSSNSEINPAISYIFNKK
jgi:tetratricopeptide (TPR) repeat protein